MGAHGRPTPRGDGDGFSDKLPEECTFPQQNPHLKLHREFGRPLLPANVVREYAGRWPDLFGRTAPLILEIGSGNGDFMTEVGRQHPEINLLGIEIRYKRTVSCARKIKAAGVQNVIIARYHAAFLRNLFGEGDLDGIWVNHPDPWPKDRHEGNRLISRWFLEDVAFFLKPGAWLRIKSDYAPNCDRVIDLLDKGPEGEPLPRLPLRITGQSRDVNGAEGAPWPGDVMTNYQGKMLRANKPVYALEVTREPDEV